MPITTTFRDLNAFSLMDGEIRLTGVELFDDPGAFIGLVAYNANGKPGLEPLRLDFGKICFLDIQPFEAAHGEAEGRRRANALALKVMAILAEPQTAKSAHAYGI